MTRHHFVLALAMIATAFATPPRAQAAGTSAAAARDDAPELRVAVFNVPPFVMEQNGSLTGFDIELWNQIAARLQRRTNYQIEKVVTALLEKMQSRQAELTVAPIPVTAARDEVFDFSYPIMESGLQIMVSENPQKTMAANPLWDMLRLILSRTTVLWLGMALLLALIPAHVVWLLERRHEDGMISSRRYFPGIFEAMYWGLSTLTTQAETMPRQWFARALSVLWMFSGVVFVASYTAQLTTTLTVEQIRGAIEGPDDLPGKHVAALAHGQAADFLREHRAVVEEFQTIDEVFEALATKKVDGVVAGAPILRYYAAHEGKGRVRIVGPEVNISPVAIMLQLNSPLRKKIDIALLTLYEDGSYQRLYEKWFGGR